MSAKTGIVFGLRVVALTLIMFLSYAGATVLSGTSGLSPATSSPPLNTSAVLAASLVVSLLEAAVLAYVILRSRWSGWKLVGAIFVAFYGLNTVVAQIESIVFLRHVLPAGMIPALFAMGAIAAGLFAPLAVLAMGKMRRPPAAQGSGRARLSRRLVMPVGEWAWKLAVIAVAYIVLYFTFGYFVAWKSPAVRAYYGGADPGFFAQMAWIGATTPWMFPLQACRAMLWTACALPVIRSHEGRAWEVALAVAMLFAVWSSQLLLPNPYMPQAVARAHLVETLASNFIFGGLVGGLLSWRHAPARIQDEQD